MQKVASVLGLEVAAKEPMVAVVRCNGTCEMRPRTNEYGGYNSCRVKAALYSGDTGCAFGCLAAETVLPHASSAPSQWTLQQVFL